jgi:hypothetical protein
MSFCGNMPTSVMAEAVLIAIELTPAIDRNAFLAKCVLPPETVVA